MAGRAPEWLFPSPSGEPFDDRYVRWHIWRALLRRAGLRHRGMHQIRHSYATLLIAHGVHPKYIQAQLGHASIQVTMDVYGHLFPDTFPRLVNALDQATIRNPDATAPVPLEGSCQTLRGVAAHPLSTCRNAARSRRPRPCPRRRAPPIA